MSTHFITPKFPSWLNAAVFAVVLGELIYYGVSTAVPGIWVVLIFALFYFGYMHFCITLFYGPPQFVIEPKSRDADCWSLSYYLLG
jgi:H+/gluconate symporter-like permease